VKSYKKNSPAVNKSAATWCEKSMKSKVAGCDMVKINFNNDDSGEVGA